MRPDGVGSEAQGKKKGERREKNFLEATRWHLKHGALTLSNSSKANLQAEKRSCDAWMVQVGVLFVQEAQAGMRPEWRPLVFGPHAG
jgi:hypothetical protein